MMKLSVCFLPLKTNVGKNGTLDGDARVCALTRKKLPAGNRYLSYAVVLAPIQGWLRN
jgi:hypothetical protein